MTDTLFHSAAIGAINRRDALKLIYRHTHRDFKSSNSGEKTILTLRQGGTSVVRLHDLTDEEIADKLKYAVSQEVARVARKKNTAASNRIADMIDGFDRDNLGESPDY